MSRLSTLYPHRSPFVMSSRLLALAALLAVACVALLALAGCAATRSGQSPSEYVDDAAITTAVRAALQDEEAVRAAAIDVDTFRSDVQLTGVVASRVQAEQALAVARRQDGVRSVRNALRLEAQD